MSCFQGLLFANGISVFLVNLEEDSWEVEEEPISVLAELARATGLQCWAGPLHLCFCRKVQVACPQGTRNAELFPLQLLEPTAQSSRYPQALPYSGTGTLSATRYRDSEDHFLAQMMNQEDGCQT